MQLNSEKNPEAAKEMPVPVEDVQRDETPLPEITSLHINGDRDENLAAVDDASGSDDNVTGIYIFKVKVPRGSRSHSKGAHPDGHPRHHHRQCRGHSPPDWADMKDHFHHGHLPHGMGGPHGFPGHPEMFGGRGRGGWGGRGGHGQNRGPGRHGHGPERPGPFSPGSGSEHGPAPPFPSPFPFAPGAHFAHHHGPRSRPPPMETSSDSESDDAPPSPHHHRGHRAHRGHRHHRGKPHRGSHGHPGFPYPFDADSAHPFPPPPFDGPSPFEGPSDRADVFSRYGPPPPWSAMGFDMPPHGRHGGPGRGRGEFGHRGGRGGFHFGAHFPPHFGAEPETAA